MAEDARDRETQAIVPNLFPLGKEPVLAAFRDLSSAENPYACQEAVNEEMRIFRETNPHVLNSLEELRESYAENEAQQMLLGNLICYRALRKEAISKSGVLPSLTEQFVENYDKEKEKSAEDELRDKGLSIGQTGQQIRRANLAIFRNKEPEFSKIVEKKFGDQSGWRPEADSRYSSIVYLYLLFSKGCSDPKNFQKTPR